MAPSSWSATRRSAAPWWTGYAARCYPEGSPMRADAIVFGIAGSLFGLIIGWVLGTQNATGTARVTAPVAQAAPAATAAAPAAQPPATLDPARVQALQTVAEKDPKNI